MNILNIKKLISTYFIENWKRDLLQYFLVFAGCIFVMSWSYTGALSKGILYSSSTIAFWMIFAVIVLVSSLFVRLSTTSSSISFLTIPASTGEKIVAYMLLANVYCVLVAFVATLLGVSLTIVGNLAVSNDFAIPVSEWISKCYTICLKDIAAVLFPMYILVSIVFFGSVYFKRRAFLKTMGAGILIGWAFGLIAILVIRVQVPSMEFNSTNFAWRPDISEKAVKVLAYVVGSCVIVYNYVLSFLRLRETEV